MSRKRLGEARWVRECAGSLAAQYLRLVWKTSRFSFEPPDFMETAERPCIATFWHGQHFMTPFMRPPGERVKVLISMHRDGDMNARAVERLGMETIRGSGAGEGRYDRKGGVRGFLALRQALSDGCTVAMTADVPKTARVVGNGIIMLGRATGCPIVPVGIATSRRIVLDNWDRSTINLPFSRGAFVFGAPIHVSAASSEQDVEDRRRELELALNKVDRRAYDLVDSPRKTLLRA